MYNQPHKRENWSWLTPSHDNEEDDNVDDDGLHAFSENDNDDSDDSDSDNEGVREPSAAASTITTTTTTCNVTPNYIHECRMYMEHLEREVHASRWLRLVPYVLSNELKKATRRACDWLFAQIRVLEHDTLLNRYQAYIANRFCSEADEHVAKLRHPTLRGKNPSRTMMMKNSRMMLDARGDAAAASSEASFSPERFTQGKRSIMFIDFILDLWSRQALGGGMSIEDALTLVDWRNKPQLHVNVRFGVFHSPLHNRWVLVEQQRQPNEGEQQQQQQRRWWWGGNGSPPLRTTKSLIELIAVVIHEQLLPSDFIELHVQTGNILPSPLNIGQLRRIFISPT